MIAPLESISWPSSPTRRQRHANNVHRFDHQGVVRDVANLERLALGQRITARLADVLKAKVIARTSPSRILS